MSNDSIQAHLIANGQPVRLSWRNGLITAIDSVSDAPDNLWLAPPLLDLQVNGYAGVDFQSDDVSLSELLESVRRLHADGCALLFLTLVSDEWPRLMKRLGRFRELRSKSQELQDAIVGWHIEGPFLSDRPGYCGAHNPHVMCDPTAGYIDELRRICGDDPVLLTIAPEREGALNAIERAVRLGIRVSLGHTDAAADRIEQAIQAGASAFTHLGNGCPRELNRHDNILWRIFETERIFASLIPDAIHVSPSFFRLAHRVLGPDRIYYVTDAMSAAGAPPGQYRLGGLMLEVGGDQIVRLPGSPNFAGSALRPIDGITRAAEMLGCSWRDIWPRYSTTPARFMGFDHNLRVGGPATFCLVETAQPSDAIQRIDVFVRGESVTRL